MTRRRTVDHCPTTEMPVAWCGCPKHRGPTERHGSEIGPIARTIRSRYTGHCPYCDTHTQVGDILHLVDSDWVCDDCGRQPRTDFS